MRNVLDLLICMMIVSAPADHIACDKVRELSWHNAEFTLQHYHDCSAKTHEARWKTISGEQNPLNFDNNDAYLRLWNKETAALLSLFQMPARAMIAKPE